MPDLAVVDNSVGEENVIDFAIAYTCPLTISVPSSFITPLSSGTELSISCSGAGFSLLSLKTRKRLANTPTNKTNISENATIHLTVSDFLQFVINTS